MINKISTNNISFNAKISDNFLSAAENYFLKNSKIPEKKYKQFCSAVRRFEELPDTDHITIDYKKYKNTEGKLEHKIVGFTDDNSIKSTLTTKDMFRKAIEKFSYMNEYEFLLKMGLIKNKK